MDTVAIFGSTSFIGKHLVSFFESVNVATYGFNRTDSSVSGFDLEKECWDLSVLENKNVKYGIITAGVTRMMQCENEPATTHKINVTATGKLMQELRALNIIPVIFSTDYVYSGYSGNYNELSEQSPLNEYGKQKKELEIFADKHIDKYILVRPAKVYDMDPASNGILSEMISAIKNNQVIRAAKDQVFNMITLTDLSKVIYFLIEKKFIGKMQVCSREIFSRYDLAVKLVASVYGSEIAKKKIQPILLADLGEKFGRPKNTTMDTQKLSDTGYRDTMFSVDDYIINLKKSNYE